MNWIKKSGAVLKQALLAASVMALVSCETVQTTQGGVVGVTRAQKMAISSQEVDQAAAQEYSQLVAQERGKGELNRNPAQVNRVRAIAQRLVPQTSAFRPDALSWNWEINVFTSPEINAWCMPGGKIAVYSGLIEKLHATDDELAAVLGHEIGHALREHARERISEQMGTGLIASGIDIIGGLYGIRNAGQIASTGLQLTMELPHSRVQETEADRIGVELAARAGYDPRAAVTLWQKMGSVGGAEPLKFLSTHPSREDRLSDLGDYSQRVMPLYEQARKNR
ncbi:MAG TPA: M48 family metallopeptidase [Burkholderiaceae bacterium]|nr:M48 family metallopeptidase [Burkholderiaceae bacterium]